MSGETIEPPLEEIILPETPVVPQLAVWTAQKNGGKLSLLTKAKVQSLDNIHIDTDICQNTTEIEATLAVLNASKSWYVGMFSLCQNVLTETTGKSLDVLSAFIVECRRGPGVELLCLLLSRVKCWRIYKLVIHSATSQTWAQLADVMGNGQIVEVMVDMKTLENAEVVDLEKVWNATEGTWADSNGMSIEI